MNNILDGKVTIDSSVIITARRVTIRTNEISWTDLDKDRWFPLGTEEVYLQKSDSPKSHFKTIYTIKRSSPTFFIDDNSMTTEYRTEIMYYRLVSKAKDLKSNVFNSENIHNLYGSEIIRRHEIQLKEGHSGSLLYLFIKNRIGERCPECWDNLRGVRTKSNCKACLNTGYINGYCDPIAIYVSLSPEQTAVEQPLTGTEVDGHIQGWTVAYPRINLGDVLVDPLTQDIWNVAAVNMTTHKRTPTKQELTLDRHNEDTEIMRLLAMIPKVPDNPRHGEALF